MNLPALKLPQIELPFDIPVLLHPPIDHFVIAIPVIVLLIEIVNLAVKKRALGVVSFFLLLLGMVAAIAAYLTGTTDGKEAFDALTQAGQAELKAHKLLGTYLMLASVVVVLFKMVSAIVRKGLVKAIYLLLLILFVAAILKQGKDGGELVYEHGANIERVGTLNDDLGDCKDELSEAEDEVAEMKEATAAKKAAETAPAPAPAPVAAKKVQAEAVNAAESTKESVEKNTTASPAEAAPAAAQQEN